MDEPTCADCLFWRPLNEAATKGLCHRFPPQVTAGRSSPPRNARPEWEQRPEHYFGMSMANQWCGEFKERE